MSVLSLQLANARLRVRTPEQFLQQAAQRIDDASARMLQNIRGRMAMASQRSSSVVNRLQQQKPDNMIRGQRQLLDALLLRLSNTVRHATQRKRTALESTARMLQSVSPLPTISRGYAVVTDSDGQVSSEVANLADGDVVKTYVSDGAFSATVTQTHTGESLDPEA